MSTTENGAGLRVKWADRIRTFVDADRQPVEMRDAHAKPLPDRYGVTDLEKTETERAAIRETVDAMNETLGTICGEEPQFVSDDRIHIVTEEEFRAKITARGFHGKADMGHVYLYRGWPLPMFQALLAHELMHAVAYLWLDVRTESARMDGGIAWPFMTSRRQGMVLIDPSYGTWLPHFHGLNEGITESAAYMIRKEIARSSRLLTDGDRQGLGGFIADEPLVAFMDRLVKTAAGPSGDVIAPWKAALADYLHGTDRFLAMLDERHPGAKEILRATGARQDELVVACDKLGFDDLATAFRLFIP